MPGCGAAMSGCDDLSISEREFDDARAEREGEETILPDETGGLETTQPLGKPSNRKISGAAFNLILEFEVSSEQLLHSQIPFDDLAWRHIGRDDRNLLRRRLRNECVAGRRFRRPAGRHDDRCTGDEHRRHERRSAADGALPFRVCRCALGCRHQGASRARDAALDRACRTIPSAYRRHQRRFPSARSCP